MGVNQYPAWKNYTLVAVFLLGLLYAIPNFYGDEPAVQIIAASNNVVVNEETLEKAELALMQDNIPFTSIELEDNNLLVRLAHFNEQLDAQRVVRQALGYDYTVALNSAATTPSWLEAIGATPMRLGLDLRGGVHLMLEVDIDTVTQRRMRGGLREVLQELREGGVRYEQQTLNPDLTFVITFANDEQMQQAYRLVRNFSNEIEITRSTGGSPEYTLTGNLTPAEQAKLRQYTIEQTMLTLRNRVNELGVSEAVVQQQGAERVSVDLPGIQNSAEAVEILGGMATLEFRMHEPSADARNVTLGTPAPVGSRLYYDRNDMPLLLKDQVILTGESITFATAGISERTGGPAVSLRLGGGGERLFYRVTRESVGQGMGIVLVETKKRRQMIEGEEVITQHREESVVSFATINSALGNSFEITGLTQAEANRLALILRSGSLPTSIEVVEERTIGPSLGQENIERGVISIIAGFVLVILAMVLYYGVFGFIANVALLLNVIFIIAIMSFIGLTLTLSGMAGIVLTIGMAVDANVLIFERIREELRNGMSVQASIKAGYEKAFVTIVDANTTTLIVAIILLAIGSGAVQAFAVTLTIGLLTSMLTAIYFTRGLVNLIYGGRQVDKLSIGLKV